MSVQSKIVPEGAKTTNKKVLAFVEEAKELFKPDAVRWCDGSKEEYQELLKAHGRWRHGHVAQSRKAPQLDPGPLRPR